MAQSANQELVQNLKPFIAQTVQNMGLSELHYDNAIANPDKPLKSSSGGLLTLVQLNSSSISNGASNDILMRAFGEVTIESGNSTDDDLILKTGGAGNVLVQGASSNVITSPIAGIADLTIEAGLGSLILDAPAGGISLKKNLYFGTSPSRIYGTGQILLDGPEEVHVLGKFYVSHPVKNVIGSAVASIPDLTISADTGDVIIDAPGDIILQPGGSVVFSGPGGNFDVDDTLHFPNLVASYITAASGLGIYPTEDITIDAGGDFFLDNDIDFSNANPSISTTTQLTLNSDDANIRLLADTDITLAASSGNVIVSTSDFLVRDGIIAGSTTVSSEVGQFRAIKTANSGTRQLVLGDAGYTLGTDYAMTYADSYFEIGPASASQGGPRLKGSSVSNHGIWLDGHVATESTVRFGTSARAPLMFRGFNKEGSVASSSNLAAFLNAGSGVFTINGNGTIYAAANGYFDGGLSVGSTTATVEVGQALLIKANGANIVQFALQDNLYTNGLAHGLGYANSYLEILAASGGSGGAHFRGTSTSNYAIWMKGSVSITSAGISGDTRAPFIFDGYLDNDAIAWTQNLATFKSGGNGIFTIQANGTVYSQGNLFLLYGGAAFGTSATPGAGQVVINDGGTIRSSFSGRSTSVTVPFTVEETSDTWYAIRRFAAAAGGAIVRGYSADRPGLILDGMADVPDNSTATYSTANVLIRAYDSNGSTGYANLSGGYNTMVLRNGGTTDFIWKAGGTAHAQISWVAFDEHDDMSIVRTVGRLGIGAIQNKWDQFVTHNEQDLHNMGLVENGFTNMTGMMMLHNGALWQLHTRISELENLSILGMIKLILNKWLRRFI